MDASASTKPDADNSVYDYFIKLDDNYPPQTKHRNTIVKYTKLPDYDFDSKAKDRKSVPVKTSHRAIETDFKEKQSTHRTTSRLTSSKYAKEIKISAKTNSLHNRKEVTSVSQQNVRKQQHHNIGSQSAENAKIRNVKEKDTMPKGKSSSHASRINVSKHVVTPSESENELTKIKSILYDNLKSNSATQKKPLERTKASKSLHQPSNKKMALFKDIHYKGKPLRVIHVPLEEKSLKRNKLVETTPTLEIIETAERGSDPDGIEYIDVMTGTDPAPKSVDQVTHMEDFQIDTMCKCTSSVQTESMNQMFDSLEIPNVTLTKDKCEPKDDTLTRKMKTSSLPNLQVPPLKIAPKEINSSDLSFCQSASYVISRATLTYTSRQKINFHVVDDDDVKYTQPPSPLNYPMNVVSVFKNELKKKKSNENVSSDESNKKKTSSRDEYINCLNELKSLNCSYVFNKLMKPSDIISTIKVNKGLLQSDYICEQFQRELNFIDSFFESLQYLESCSLSEKCYQDTKVESFVNNSMLFDSTFDVKNSEYDNFLSKLENGANIDDTETMASKSLCLLNLLIRDEQRRAKNLLFVLKMREDALKDFTKSQILWLEKKKKHDNTDISTLKKKQRGALLKLQHECGEMQRMRKALLTLSEKRKVALMKTKKNIELKLKNNVEVEQIILGKKRLKRNSCTDRNAPLKCFDLSSSGCEESTTSRPNSEATFVACEAVPSAASVTSAEKCVQTSDPPTALMDSTTDTAAENFVVVDGGYLNILFHNLTLPQIFSSGKQYEVNEEALRNIVNSANNHNNSLSGSDVVEKLMDQIKNKDSDKSPSTPSTARSLIEEFDQYYKNLIEDDKTPAASSEIENDNSNKISEIKDSSVQSVEIKSEPDDYQCGLSASQLKCNTDSTSIVNETDLPTVEPPCVCESVASVESQCSLDTELGPTSQVPTGPLPVPVGAAAVADSQPADSWTTEPAKSSISSTSDAESVSSQPLCASVSPTISSLAAPVHCEAEELRRQQLAIEREIKALEQQQCRLLVVREIPDKPPPPYTPPTETRAPKPPRMFAPDESIKDSVEKHITQPDTATEPTEAFDVFLKEFCDESVERHKQEQSDKPWDACNLLPQKPQVDLPKLVEKTASELKEVLTSVTPTTVSGVSSRRSDHIDDILFAEWRRCEPEWTALHTDEAIVKNQIFESIFQKILTDTVDEYKKTVLCNVVTTE
ncbi:unnamed protein product [Chrysodeixis includens]|uniref:Uncharacterized protein n=1 Tax=Chrysodeixis includens TaxID=689277 RepID=A0A9P0BKX6_CHRIL|nr:unnamed protein product [Chrysodeixis includens]